MLKSLILMSLIFTCNFWLMAQSASNRTEINNAATNTRLEKQQNALIKFERSECFGSCPIYRVEIYGDGKLIYEGKEYVKTKGQVLSKISSKQLKHLMIAFKNANFFLLQDSYSEDKDCIVMASDSPWVHISMQINEKSKQIDHYLGCLGGKPKLDKDLKKLSELEKRIDEIINIEQWIGTEDERRKLKDPLRRNE